MHPIDHVATTRQDEELDAIRGRFDDVMGSPGEPPPVDVRAYLLDPPPTPEEAERLERRRMLVRRGSIVACVVLGIALFAPWPGGAQGEAPVRTAAAAPETEPVEPAEPVRVDVPPRTTTAPARRPNPRRHAPRARPAVDVPPAPQPSRPAPAPRQQPSPVAPSAPSSSDAGVLVPVM